MTTPLDLDQLQSFCAIADCGSFTEAARRVNKTQSAVSMQIKRLEERLGHALLSRDGRTVALTQHGEALYSRARKMLKINAEIMDLFSRRGAGRLDPLRRARRLRGAPAAGDPVELPEAPTPRSSSTCAASPSEELLEGMKQGTLRPHRASPRAPTANMASCSAPSGCSGSPRMAARRCNTDPLPIAGGQPCCWKDNAVEVLDPHRAATTAWPTPRRTRSPSPRRC